MLELLQIVADTAHVVTDEGAIPDDFSATVTAFLAALSGFVGYMVRWWQTRGQAPRYTRPPNGT